MARRKKSSYIIVFLIAFGLILILNWTGGDYIKQGALAFINPVENFLQKQTTVVRKNISSWFYSKSKLRSKVEKLTNENSQLLFQINKEKSFQEENVQLRKALGLEINQEMDLRAVKNIGVRLNRGEILINKGEDDGLRENQTVITPNKEIVGTSNRIYPHYSTVKTIFTEGSSWKVFVYDQKSDSRIEGVIRGKGYSDLELDLVPIQTPLEKNNIVVTQESSFWPADLIIGEINKIYLQDLESFKKASVTPRINLNELSLLFIVKSF